jgi:steroid 5-alpha reductase family enzyme
MSRQAPQDPSIERIVVCFWLYTFGIMFMVLTDGQKYLVLRERAKGQGGLITHCMVGWSRNMNYLGEMMLYASFAVLNQMWTIWYVYAYMWGIVFVVRMQMKEYSLSKKEGWTEYKNRTWLVIPKIYNSTLLSFLIYGTFLLVSYYCYTHGGIELGFKSAFSAVKAVTSDL